MAFLGVLDTPPPVVLQSDAERLATMPTGSFQLPEAPAVPGLTFRHLRDEQDAAAVHALRGGCVEADQVDLLSTSEDLPSQR